MFGLFATHYFWLAIGASALNSAILAVAAGFAAKTDHGTWFVVLLVLTVASQLLSSLYFLSGRGIDLVVHRLLDPRHLHPQSPRFQRVRRYMEKYETLYVFMYRFLPGLRFISPYIMGAGRERFWPFFVWDWFASLCWASLFGLLGYLFGTAATRVIDDFAEHDTEIFGAVFAAVFLYVAFKYVISRRVRSRR